MVDRSQPMMPPRGPKGRRAYVIGDVHGRLDLLDRLLAAIEAEIDARPVDRVLLVSLGDLSDRGPTSAGVVERLRTYRHQNVQPVYVLGNHEEVLLRILGGESGLIQKWLWFGGAQCIQSYGVELEALKRMT